MNQAPVVSAFDPQNAAATAVTAITVAGFNFVTADLTMSVRMQPSICATQSWIANTGVKCEVGTPGFGTGLSAAITVAGMSGTVLEMFSFDGKHVYCLAQMHVKP